MTPWLRGLRATGLLIALGAGVLVSPYGAMPSYGAESLPGGHWSSPAAGTPAPAAERSRAGHRADDEGRDRLRWREDAWPHGRGPSYRAGAGPVGRPAASPHASASAADPSRAGSLAGEGRQRPGRQEVPPPRDETAQNVPGTDEGGLGEVTVVPEPSREAAGMPSGPPTAPDLLAHPGSPAGSPLPILPLGSGLMLVGLGLGLAFLGLRLRRG
ncbi:hypothetical protein F7R91_06535 [Streptomyces luteolifulvus]|uniref:Uncharacterized protein n=1 Tax=Streptomyces luteolifulvus TaxID=2615112 RepID=A0A6H9V697_9ACTN|nr:hypothetical protein [Streptomyces luteolifulvus]KAB1149399.1 hypothetical protein F7R91_06535 [Streptomyces luteolifulvus]